MLVGMWLNGPSWKVRTRSRKCFSVAEGEGSAWIPWRFAWLRVPYGSLSSFRWFGRFWRNCRRSLPRCLPRWACSGWGSHSVSAVLPGPSSPLPFSIPVVFIFSVSGGAWRADFVGGSWQLRSSPTHLLQPVSNLTAWWVLGTSTSYNKYK